MAWLQKRQPALEVPSSSSPSSLLPGMLLFLLALALFASYDAFAKHMLQWYSPEVMNFSRYITINAMALALLLSAYPGASAWQQVRSHARNRLLWLRSICLGAVATCFMTALVQMPLAEATAIYFTAPLIMVALSGPLLGEITRPAQWWGVIIGFAGMLLMVRPGMNLPLIPSVMMVIAAASYALFQILTRKLSGRVPYQVQFFYMAWICLVMTFMPALFRSQLRWPHGYEWWPVLLGGVVSGAAQLLLLAAYKRVPAATLAPLNYLHLMMTVVISIVWFQKVPDLWAMVGMSLIAAAGVYLGWHQRKKRM